MSSPKFEIDDTIYLAESAKKGFIEAYQVAEIRQNPSGTWLYRVVVSARPPFKTTTLGDMITKKQSVDWEIPEDEIVGLCEAVNTAIGYHNRVLDQLTSIRDSRCIDETTGSS